jgi:hypothetical protein
MSIFINRSIVLSRDKLERTGILHETGKKQGLRVTAVSSRVVDLSLVEVSCNLTSCEGK